MASGVPVVQPRRGAFPEILEKTGGGILVEPGDPAGLADGIYRLWKDPALAVLDTFGAGTSNYPVDSEIVSNKLPLKEIC